MVFRTRFLATLFIGATAVVASPALVSRGRVTSLSESQVAAFKPYALLARAAMCKPAQLKDWSCGPACGDLPGMKVSAVGGNGFTEANWFVGYYPDLDTIVVSNQATDPANALPSMTDADFFLTPLDANLFPGVPSEVQVHDGFKESQAMSAQKKLDAVKTLMSAHSASSITLTGLGRGGAISLLDAVYLPLHLPSSTKFKVVTHGMPRVGNQAFANYVDSHLSDVSRVTNKQDPLPILPGRFLGFHHSSGEKHIVTETGEWVACDGQDNVDHQCSTGAVPNVVEGDVRDNQGPYNGVIINGDACNA